MKYEPLQLPVLGMNRKKPAIGLPPGFWRTVVNSDLYPGKFRRRKGSTQLHTPDSGGVPAGCTLWDFLEMHEEELGQDKMLLLLEDSGGATELWKKIRAAGGSYGDFSQVTWAGTLDAWSDNLLGTSFPYPKILRVPLSARIIPTDADAEARILFYQELASGFSLFAKTQGIISIAGQHFHEARILDPREIETDVIAMTPTSFDGTNGDLGPYKAYYYCYTIVYEDGQESLPWIKDSRSKIPDDVYWAGSWYGLAGWHNHEDAAACLNFTVPIISTTTPTKVPLRIAGINVWRAAQEGFGAASGVVQTLGDFHLLGFISFGRTGAIGDYYETQHSFSGVTPTVPSGYLKRFDTGINLTASTSRWGSSGALSPVDCALRITAVAGDETHALVGEFYRIEDHGTPTDQDIDVYDPNNDLATDTAHSGVIVEGILAYGADTKFHAQLLDMQDDISASPEMWSVLGVTPGEYTIAAQGKYGSLARGRMTLANCYIEGKHHPSRACMSLRGRYDTFPSYQQMEFDWDGGEPIEGPLTYTGTGVLVFKDHQVGFFNIDEDDLNVYVAQSEILEEDGLASAESIVKAWNAVFWAGYKGIWMFMEGYGFLKISDGEYSKTEKPRGGIQEIFDLMHDDDKALCASYYNPETRKVGFCVPIVSGSNDWDDILDPITAPTGLNDSYVSFEFDFTGPAWNLADPAIRKSRKGVEGELFSTDFTDIDQWNANYGSEQETSIILYAESPWMGGIVVKLTAIKSIYKDGPLYISMYRETGLRGPSIVLPDTLGDQKTVQRRLGTGGNPLWLVAEARDEIEVRELHLAGRGLERVVDR